MSAVLLAYHHGSGHDGRFPFFPLVPLLFFGLWIAAFVLVARRWRPWDRRSGAKAGFRPTGPAHEPSPRPPGLGTALACGRGPFGLHRRTSWPVSMPCTVESAKPR